MAFTATIINSEAAWRPDVYTFAAADIIPDALVIACSTKGGVIEGDQPVVRCAYIDDADASFVVEDSEIQSQNRIWPKCSSPPARSLSSSGSPANNGRRKAPPPQLAASVARAVTRRADLAFMQQVAPTPPALGPSTGLLNVADVVDIGEVTGNLDVLIDGIAELQENLSNPTHIVLSRTAWSEFRKLKVGFGLVVLACRPPFASMATSASG